MMKKLLFNRKSACVQPLRALVEKQKHRTLAMWAIDCAGAVLVMFEQKYPAEKRPRQALEAGRKWMRGEIRMSAAKRAILDAHQAANEVDNDPVACAAARAVAHAAAAVHVETHALGLVFYSLTAIVRAAEPENVDDVVAKECQRYYDRLLHWEKCIDQREQKWAPFLLKDAPNKELLWRIKQEKRKIAESK